MKPNTKTSFVKPFLWWGLGVVIIIIAYWSIMSLIYKAKFFQPWLEPNEFGDMFGFLSCLFSGLAFAGLIVTIRQQKEDLELQRKELQRANNEAAEQTAQFEAQTKQFQEQIELARQAQKIDEFYRRIALLKQQIEILTIDMGNDIHTGYKALYYALIEVYDFKEQLWDSTNWEFKKNTFAQILNWSHYFFELAHDYLDEPTFIKILTNSLTPFEVDFLYIMQETTKNHHCKDIIKKLENKSNLFSSKNSHSLRWILLYRPFAAN